MEILLPTLREIQRSQASQLDGREGGGREHKHSNIYARTRCYIMLTVPMCIFTVISLLIYLTMLAVSDYTV